MSNSLLNKTKILQYNKCCQIKAAAAAERGADCGSRAYFPGCQFFRLRCAFFRRRTAHLLNLGRRRSILVGDKTTLESDKLDRSLEKKYSVAVA